ncbi:MAG: hypothetical protein HC769_31525 [Cyanobacteria bacterium CRU_2_1]|nr:hypothetical protein [Cyanobacteria bacterium CRU_2_1]
MIEDTDREFEIMRLQVDIAEEVKTALKIEALRQGKTLSELVEDALRITLPICRQNRAKAKK